MSLELVDLRAKITQETDAVLDAVHRATGKERSEIVREVMAGWAEQRIHECTLVRRQLKAKGLAGNEVE